MTETTYDEKLLEKIVTLEKQQHKVIPDKYQKNRKKSDNVIRLRTVLRSHCDDFDAVAQGTSDLE